MDDNVGQTINVQFQRHGILHEAEIAVQDFSKLPAYQILEYSGAALQEIRFQHAAYYNVPIGGVLLHCLSGSFKLGDYPHKLITSFNNQKTPDLAAFVMIAQKIPGEWPINFKDCYTDDQ